MYYLQYQIYMINNIYKERCVCKSLWRADRSLWEEKLFVVDPKSHQQHSCSSTNARNQPGLSWPQRGDPCTQPVMKLMITPAAMQPRQPTALQYRQESEYQVSATAGLWRTTARVSPPVTIHRDLEDKLQFTGTQRTAEGSFQGLASLQTPKLKFLPFDYFLRTQRQTSSAWHSFHSIPSIPKLQILLLRYNCNEDRAFTFFCIIYSSDIQ